MQTIQPYESNVYKIPFKPHSSQKQFLDEALFYEWRAALGGTGCLPVYTRVYTPKGLKPLCEVERVLSWNFNKNRVEVKKANYSPSGMKPIYLIETGIGDMRCSPEHRWFVQGGIVKGTTDLLVGDNLMRARSSSSQGWGQYEQQCREPYDSLSGLSLSATRIRSITKLDTEVEMGDLHVPDTHNFILSNGIITHNSGKTYLGGFELIRLCTNFRGIETVAFSPTFGMIKRNVIPVLRTLLGGSIENSPLVDQFHKGDMVIYWQNGSTTWLNSLEFPERAEGQSLDLVWIDEARLVRNLELALMVIQRRLRGSPTGKASGFKPLAYMTTTPDYPGSELHAFCENPETRHPNLKVIRMPLIDNTANLPQNYIDNVIRAHSGGLAEQFIYGRFAMVEMGSFAFDYTQHVIPNMIYDPALHRKICFGVDFGWDNPSAIVVIGFDGDDRAYILDEYYKNMTSIDELVNELKDFYTVYGKGTAYCDPTEKQTVETMKQKGIIARPCLVKRDDGIRELGGRFQLQGDGRYRIYINSNCVNTISELQTYNAEKKERDHACDAARYVCSSVRPMGPVRGRRGRVS